eukprot:Rhum_TRINITY_DN18962_c0_g1::Rhum_TRINITY_DN18962_c0_g1_i1::g.168882::m.168882
MSHLAASDAEAVAAAARAGTLVYAVLTVPTPGETQYKLAHVCHKKVRPCPPHDGQQPPASPALPSPHRGPPLFANPEVYSRDVVASIAAFLDPFSLARMRAACTRFHAHARPTPQHQPAFLSHARTFGQRVAAVTLPAVSVVAVQGRTAASQRVAVCSSLPQGASAIERAYFQSTQPMVVRELAQLLSPDAVLDVSNMPADAVQSTVVHELFKGHAVEGFWRWCHDDVAVQHRPRLQLGC